MADNDDQNDDIGVQIIYNLRALISGILLILHNSDDE
jgi:hypothetical protein